MLFAVNVPWVAADMHMAPKAAMDDGSLDLIVVKSDVSRCSLISMFLEVHGCILHATHVPHLTSGLPFGSLSYNISD